MSLIHYTTADHIAEILIDNPPVNALSEQLLDDYLAALHQASQDEDVRAVIVSSAVPGRFCAGLDLKAIHEGQAHVPELLERLYRQLTDAQYALNKPSIAAVNGTARGGGMTMSISCDVIIASDDSTFGYPEIDAGVLPSIHFGHLPKIVGKHRAFELLFSGRSFGPDEAKELGLVSHVVPAAELMAQARELAGVFSSKPRDVMRLGRQAFKAGSDPQYRASISAAVDNFCHVASLPDAKEGFAAFAQKRQPKWNAS